MGVYDVGTYTSSYAYVEGKYDLLLLCLLFGYSSHYGQVSYDPNYFCYWSFNAGIDPLGRWAWTDVKAYAGPTCSLDSHAYARVNA